ncbi:Flp family type IVb pilin [Loktanella sp. DJP18]|uniref:Flp family type IVb pilin n=1 Tax=Loktanella sp. DJP18 TaxID=3409788 RepID=UPI003BB65A1D
MANSNTVKRLKRSVSGAALVEYVILVTLIGTTSIAAVSQLGKAIDKTYNDVTASIATAGDPGAGSPGGSSGGGGPGSPGGSSGGEGSGDLVDAFIPNQSFEFPTWAPAGTVVHTVTTDGTDFTAYSMTPPGAGLIIDNSGDIIVVDPAAFGAFGTTRDYAVEGTTTDNRTASTTVRATRADAIDPNVYWGVGFTYLSDIPGGGFQSVTDDGSVNSQQMIANAKTSCTDGVAAGNAEAQMYGEPVVYSLYEERADGWYTCRALETWTMTAFWPDNTNDEESYAESWPLDYVKKYLAGQKGSRFNYNFRVVDGPCKIDDPYSSPAPTSCSW